VSASSSSSSASSSSEMSLMHDASACQQPAAQSTPPPESLTQTQGAPNSATRASTVASTPTSAIGTAILSSSQPTYFYGSRQHRHPTLYVPSFSREAADFSRRVMCAHNTQEEPAALTDCRCSSSASSSAPGSQTYVGRQPSHREHRERPLAALLSSAQAEVDDDDLAAKLVVSPRQLREVGAQMQMQMAQAQAPALAPTHAAPADAVAQHADDTAARGSSDGGRSPRVNTGRSRRPAAYADVILAAAATIMGPAPIDASSPTAAGLPLAPVAVGRVAPDPVPVLSLEALVSTCQPG
jgi:hypothetical protein